MDWRFQMPTNEALSQAVEIYRAKERKLLEDLQSVRIMIRQMELDLGEAPSGPEIQLSLADSMPPMAERIEIANGRKPEIRPDEFFGMTQAEAARKYLKRIGHAISFEELVSALQAGGCKVGGENPKKILYISLVRNTRDFVPPQTGYIGLREFYPSGAGGRPTKDRLERAPRKSMRAKKDRRAPKKQATPQRTTEASKTKTAKKKSSLGPVVRAILGDKQARTIDEIVTAVSAKVGIPVQRISLVGVLGSKDFEKTDGKYRLAI
jgi:hypothetical protein